MYIYMYMHACPCILYSFPITGGTSDEVKKTQKPPEVLLYNVM